MTTDSADLVQVLLRQHGTEKPLRGTRGQLLLSLLREHGVKIAAPCGGRGICGKCGVLVDGVRRLSCRYRLEHDITVDVASHRKATVLSDAVELKHVVNDAGVTAVDGAVPYGIAVDIGTTTVVVYLEDLAAYRTVDAESFVNPQGDYGHDVVSRIHHTMEHPDGLVQLQGLIREGVSEAIRELCERNAIAAGVVRKAVIAGNTTMLHLFAGADPTPIAQAPYTPRFVEQQTLSGAESGLALSPDAQVVLLASVSAYVGADITAGIASTDLRERDDYSLFIDIGTNGEMALGNRERLFCCSTAAGPAFEGATIHHGTGGIEGAVSRYHEGAYETIGATAPIGICGSGVLDIAAELLRTGAADMGGYMEKDQVIVPAAESATGGDIVFTPADLREVQLATAAIFAGIRILVQQAGVSLEQVGRLYLAGGFGNYLRVESAVAVGLLPESLKDRIVPVGNSAGSGARLALRSKGFAAEVARVASAASYVELSMRQDFNDEYVMAMMLGPR